MTRVTARAVTDMGGHHLMSGFGVSDLRALPLGQQATVVWSTTISTVRHCELGELLNSAKYEFLARYLQRKGYNLHSAVEYGNTGSITMIRIGGKEFRAKKLRVYEQ